MKLLIAESEGFNPEALALLRDHVDVTVADLDRSGLAEAIRDCDALWVRLRNRIDAELLAAAERLRVIVTPTTGLNHIDLAETERRGIAVLSLKGETEFLRTVRATVEHTLALTLALLRNLKPAMDHAASGGWNRDLFRGREIQGATVGVVGYGRLGSLAAEYFTALGATVLVSDPNVPALSMADYVEPRHLPELLADSDIVTLHVNLDETTVGFFDASAFEQMKPGAVLINTARGELLDEPALLESLKSGRLAGAALDVVCDENAAGMAGHPLVEYAREQDNLLLTPHIGGCTNESMERTELFMAEKLVQCTPCE